MRRLLIVVIVSLFAVAMFAWSQEIYEANQITVGWAAPEFLVDGDPIPAEDVLAYNLYMKLPGETVPDKESDQEAYDEFLANHVIGTVYELKYVITVPDGTFEAGVSALRYIGGVGSPYESDILWSLEADPPFLLRNGRPTKVVPNMYVIQ